MLSSRVPDDTLFLYFEADFRFHAQDCMDPTEWLPFLSPEPVARVDRFSGTAHWKFTEGQCSPELLDVVRICTEAHRHGYGECVWLSWNAAETGSTKRRNLHKIQYGSQAVAFTKAGAERFLSMMEGKKPEHFDLWLKRMLKEGDPFVPASYVQPPIGGFTTHRSDNLKGESRESSWSEPWALEGSGREKQSNGEGRRLLKLRDWEGQEIAKLEFHTDRRALWLTENPPTTARPDDCMSYLLKEVLGWMTPRGEYTGPWKGQKYSDPPKWQALVWSPNAYPEPVAWGKGGQERTQQVSQVRLTYLQERLVTLCVTEADTVRSETENDRQKRHRNSALSHYRLRCQPRGDETALSTWLTTRLCSSGISEGPTSFSIPIP